MKKNTVLLIQLCLIISSCSVKNNTTKNSTISSESISTVNFKEDDGILIDNYEIFKCAIFSYGNGESAFYTYKSELNAATKKFLCYTSGYYFFTSDSKYLINIENKDRLYELNVYKISNWKKIKTINLGEESAINDLEKEIINIQFSESETNLSVTYYNKWNEVTSKFIINLKKLTYYTSALVENLNNNSLSFPNVEYYEKKIYLTGLLEIDRQTGLKIEQSANNELSVKINDEEKLLIKNVWYFIYNSEIKKSIIFLKQDENNNAKILLLDCYSFELTELGFCMNTDIILTDNWDFMAYQIEDSNSKEKEILYFRLNNPEEKRSFVLKNLLIDNYKNCFFVNFSYPYIGLLFELDGDYNEYICINLMSGQTKYLNIKKEQIDYTLPDIE